MGRSASRAIDVPIAAGLPAWLAVAPRFQWLDIPNSILGPGLSPAFLQARHFKVAGGTVTWGVNKFGVGIANPLWPQLPWGSIHYSFGNMPWDRVNARALFGNGDTHWPENGVHALEIRHDAPRWVAEVVRGTDRQDFKFNPRSSTDFAWDPIGHLNADGTVNDPRFDRHYDGRPKGCHLSWHKQYNARRNWFLSIGGGQVYPWDAGAFSDVHIGDLNTGDWLDRAFKGWDAKGDPKGVTIPNVPTVASAYSTLTVGPAAGSRVAFNAANPCCISVDETGDIFIVTDIGPNVHRLTNALIGTAVNPWEPLSPDWISFYGKTTDPMLSRMATGTNRNLALGFNWTDNYLLLIGFSHSRTDFCAAVFDFNAPSPPYPCTFKTGSQLGMTFTGPAALAVQGFNNYGTGASMTQDWPVWNSDLRAFLWWESATGKVIVMEPRANWEMRCDYLAMQSGAADTPPNWAGAESRRLGWDFIPSLHLMVFRGLYNQPMKCFRTD